MNCFKDVFQTKVDNVNQFMDDRKHGEKFKSFLQLKKIKNNNDK